MSQSDNSTVTNIAIGALVGSAVAAGVYWFMKSDAADKDADNNDTSDANLKDNGDDTSSVSSRKGGSGKTKKKSKAKSKRSKKDKKGKKKSKKSKSESEDKIEPEIKETPKPPPKKTIKTPKKCTNNLEYSEYLIPVTTHTFKPLNDYQRYADKLENEQDDEQRADLICTLLKWMGQPLSSSARLDNPTQEIVDLLSDLIELRLDVDRTFEAADLSQLRMIYATQLVEKHANQNGNQLSLPDVRNLMEYLRETIQINLLCKKPYGELNWTRKLLDLLDSGDKSNEEIEHEKLQMKLQVLRDSFKFVIKADNQQECGQAWSELVNTVLERVYNMDHSLEGLMLKHTAVQLLVEELMVNGNSFEQSSLDKVRSILPKEVNQDGDHHTTFKQRKVVLEMHLMLAIALSRVKGMAKQCLDIYCDLQNFMMSEINFDIHSLDKDQLVGLAIGTPEGDDGSTTEELEVQNLEKKVHVQWMLDAGDLLFELCDELQDESASHALRFYGQAAYLCHQQLDFGFLLEQSLAGCARVFFKRKDAKTGNQLVENALDAWRTEGMIVFNQYKWNHCDNMRMKHYVGGFQFPNSQLYAWENDRKSKDKQTALELAIESVFQLVKEATGTANVLLCAEDAITTLANYYLSKKKWDKIAKLTNWYRSAMQDNGLENHPRMLAVLKLECQTFIGQKMFKKAKETLEAQEAILQELAKVNVEFASQRVSEESVFEFVTGDKHNEFVIEPNRKKRITMAKTQIAASKCSQAEVWVEMSNIRRANKAYKEALEILTPILGSNHEKVLDLEEKVRTVR